MSEVFCVQCKIVVSAESKVCPFCKEPLVSSLEKKQQDTTDVRKRQGKVQQGNFSAFKDLCLKYGKWFALAFLVLLMVFAVFAGSLLMVRPPIEIPKDPVFSIKVEKVKKGLRIVLLKGTITNRGEDIRDLSLRSLGVTAEFVLSDGRVEKKRFYPESLYRGDGTLFHGESGVFEIEVPPAANAVTLRAEIVDLGEDRVFTIPMQRKKVPSGAKKKK